MARGGGLSHFLSRRRLQHLLTAEILHVFDGMAKAGYADPAGIAGQFSVLLAPRVRHQYHRWLETACQSLALTVWQQAEGLEAVAAEVEADRHLRAQELRVALAGLRQQADEIARQRLELRGQPPSLHDEGIAKVGARIRQVRPAAATAISIALLWVAAVVCSFLLETVLTWLTLSPVLSGSEGPESELLLPGAIMIAVALLSVGHAARTTGSSLSFCVFVTLAIALAGLRVAMMATSLAQGWDSFAVGVFVGMIWLVVALWWAWGFVPPVLDGSRAALRHAGRMVDELLSLHAELRPERHKVAAVDREWRRGVGDLRREERELRRRATLFTRELSRLTQQRNRKVARERIAAIRVVRVPIWHIADTIARLLVESETHMPDSPTTEEVRPDEKSPVPAAAIIRWRP